VGVIVYITPAGRWKWNVFCKSYTFYNRSRTNL